MIRIALRVATAFMAVVLVLAGALAAYLYLPFLFMRDTAPPVYPPDCDRRIVMIDPGHGGANEGARTFWGELEKNRNLRIAKFLKRHLEATGRWEVRLTRDSDVFLQNHVRPEIANAAGADLLISIHSNASDRGLSGFAVVWYAAKRDARSRDLAVRVAAHLRSAGFRPDMGMGPHYDGPRPPEKSARYRLTDDPLPVYVSEREDYRMIYPANMPGVLIETHYLSDPIEALRFASDIPLRRMAVALEAALADFIENPPPDVGEGWCDGWDI